MARSLDSLKTFFFEKPHLLDPVLATHWGLKGYDHLFPLEDEADRTERTGFAREILAGLKATDDSRLEMQDRIDAKIMRAHAEWQILSIEKPWPLGWRTSAGISCLVEGILYNVLRQTGKVEEWDAILARMNRFPDHLRAKQENLRTGLRDGLPFYRREILRDAVELRETVLAYFKKDVLQAARTSLSESVRPIYERRIFDSIWGIEAALADYVEFLRADILPVATDGAYPIGEAEYARRLRETLFVTRTPAELFEYAHAEVDKTESEMRALAAKIRGESAGSRDLLGEVFRDLNRAAPANDREALALYRALVERTVAFLRDGKFFRLPENYSIELMETPAAFHNVLSVAAMNSIPPFTEGVSSQFWVTPTRTRAHPDGDPELLRLNHCFAAAPNLVVHEAIPGHDLQLGAAVRAFVAGGRKDLSYRVRLRMPWIMSALGVEGWAHYTEQLMAEAGFYTPEEHLFQLKDAQWRNARVVVDVGIHSGLMTYEDAVAYFDAKTFCGNVTARREIYRYSKWPLQAITYHLGKRDLLDLREDVRKAVGPDLFNLALFHEEVLKYKGVPVSFYKDDLITTLQERKTG